MEEFARGIRRRIADLAGGGSRNIAALAEKGVAAAFSDAVRIQTPDCVFLYISGQTPIDDEGRLVGRTMKAQTRQVLARLKRIVAHEGGTMADIVRVRVYATELTPVSVLAIHEACNEYFAPDRRPASTLVGIDRIIRDGAMVEIDAEAVIAEEAAACS